ncbi:MAG: ABC transporter [Acidimicrobiales bacterium mtb01]|nr:ABC transporter [Actinomycetota bacterium]TEX48301.1 MAG: ABC transporter [Acidimicrobiales bacterium mtb01]
MTSTFLVARVIPPIFRGARRPQRMVERSIFVYRRTWMILVSGFFEPLFYLLSIRIGFGSLVGDVDFAGRSIDYAKFVAPALMASSAMNGAVYDSTMNIFFKLRHERLYDAVLATPMGSKDVALGEIGWALLRGTIYSTTFLACLLGLGMADSAWVVLSLPACMLVGLAFASVGMAATTYMRSWVDFEWVQTIVMPLFLFSATFYPLSSYGDWGWLVQLSPLYHGVSLVRCASLGIATWGILVHVVVLLGISIVGLSVSARRIDELLLK